MSLYEEKLTNTESAAFEMTEVWNRNLRRNGALGILDCGICIAIYALLNGGSLTNSSEKPHSANKWIEITVYKEDGIVPML